MRGDLPFDPFMIRQRSPYWMYSLEELRCDLTAFGEAVKLEAEGFPLARHVQYAILFDRLFRFPVTGGRVRNYDGLGGQLLFAFLHHEGYLHWTDNRLVIEWDDGRRGRRRAARAGRRALPLGDRPLEARPVDRGARPRRRPTCRRPSARSGRRSAASCPRSRSRSSSSTSSATTSSRSASSTRSWRRSWSRRWRGGPRAGAAEVGLMGELDGRVIAIAGAGGGLGPVVAQRFADGGRDAGADRPRRDRLQAADEELGLPRTGSTPRSSTCSTRRRRAAGARRWSSGSAGSTGSCTWSAAGAGETRSRASTSATTSGCTSCSCGRSSTRRAPSTMRSPTAGTGASRSSPPRRRRSPEGTNAAYAATKGAAESWTLALADSFAGTGATANIVVINAILTPAMREAHPRKEYPGFTPAERDRRGARLPLLRRGVADERPAALAAPVSLMTRADPRGFASDNRSGAHPEVLEAIARRQRGPRGLLRRGRVDGARRRALPRPLRRRRASRSPVFNGTAANVLAIDALTRPHEAVICADGAHIARRRVRRARSGSRA